MLYIDYQISTTFFDGRIEVEQESDEAIDFQEAKETLEEYENDFFMILPNYGMRIIFLAPEFSLLSMVNAILIERLILYNSSILLNGMN